MVVWDRKGVLEVDNFVLVGVSDVHNKVGGGGVDVVVYPVGEGVSELIARLKALLLLFYFTSLFVLFLAFFFLFFFFFGET